MAIENIYWNSVSDFGAFGTDCDDSGTASWSLDINIPAQKAYASAALSYCSGTAWCGVMAYFPLDKLDDGTQFQMPHIPVPPNKLVVPAICDENVVTVAFLYGALQGYADCNFQILGYGQAITEEAPLAKKPGPGKICVLYDPQDGRVIHTHRVITFPGGQEVTDSEAGARAKERATQAGHDVRSVGTLLVADDDCDGSSLYHVDVAEGKLHNVERSAKSD